jgi:hypothetical protein
MKLKYWQKALREAERELDAATTRSALDAAAKKLMRAKAKLKRLGADASASSGVEWGRGRGRATASFRAM